LRLIPIIGDAAIRHLIAKQITADYCLSHCRHLLNGILLLLYEDNGHSAIVRLSLNYKKLRRGVSVRAHVGAQKADPSPFNFTK
jgi:hypothetical protein